MHQLSITVATHHLLMISVKFNSDAKPFAINTTFLKGSWLNKTASALFSINTAIGSGPIDPPPPDPTPTFTKELLQLQSDDYPIFCVGFNGTALNLNGPFRELEIASSQTQRQIAFFSSVEGNNGGFRGIVKDLQIVPYSTPFLPKDPALGSFEGSLSPVDSFYNVTIMGEVGSYVTAFYAELLFTEPENIRFGYFVSNKNIGSSSFPSLFNKDVGEDRIVQLRTLTNPPSGNAQVNICYTMERINGRGTVFFDDGSQYGDAYRISYLTTWFESSTIYDRKLSLSYGFNFTTPVEFSILSIKFLS